MGNCVRRNLEGIWQNPRRADPVPRFDLRSVLGSSRFAVASRRRRRIAKTTMKRRVKTPH